MFEELLELYKTKLAEKEMELNAYQATIQLVTAIQEMSLKSLSGKSEAALLKKLEDQVSRQSKELRDLKAELTGGKKAAPPEKKSKALDGHARNLIEHLSEEQGRYTAGELVDLLGSNKTSVIAVMKRATALDPDHLLQERNIESCKCSSHAGSGWGPHELSASV